MVPRFSKHRIHLLFDFVCGLSLRASLQPHRPTCGGTPHSFKASVQGPPLGLYVGFLMNCLNKYWTITKKFCTCIHASRWICAVIILAISFTFCLVPTTLQTFRTLPEAACMSRCAPAGNLCMPTHSTHAHQKTWQPPLLSG